MNGNIQAARQLLAELREAFQSLPGHVQVQITYRLRESAPADVARPQACELTLQELAVRVDEGPKCLYVTENDIAPNASAGCAQPS